MRTPLAMVTATKMKIRDDEEHELAHDGSL
jgi:hypothetical protein